MAKKQYLKITKHDKTVHLAPVSTKNKLNAQNRLQPAGKQYKIEEVWLTDEEVEKMPRIDNSYVPSAGNNELALLKKINESKDVEIEQLKAQLTESGPKVIIPPNISAAELITLINNATSIEEVNELLGSDTRISVSKAAEAKKATLSESGL